MSAVLQTLTVSGARWKTSNGLAVRDPVSKLELLYPNATAHPGSYWLVKDDRAGNHALFTAVVRGGRPSLSIYKIRRRFERFTLLDVELRTGRTHQIRVHLAWLKYPVVGDEVYGAGRDKTVINPVIRSRIAKLGRQFLHAEHLGFSHPRTEQKMAFTSPLPKELQALVDEIEP